MQVLSVLIPPDLAEVDAVAPRLTAEAASLLPEDRLPAFEIAVVEALTNVIRHGGLRPDQRIGITLERGQNHLITTITDEGPAPPPDLFTRPLSDDPMAESGRGIGLILMCADDVAVLRDSAGNRLVLRFDG